jgi:hypothetical protein
MHEGGRFGADNRESSPLGSISVGLAGNHWIVVVSGCQLRESDHLEGWGA